ncbi:lmo0937 family membrane protein [Flavobacterium sp. 25HG05S-40]|uniref:lmo0937 family membrane protein n=1 Tax=Flavobacterium sp. 25HG05S-40 TaxID=3458682 RepID=UPI004044C2E6
MQNLHYSVVLIVLVFWALGFFIYNIGPIIHLLLVVAAIVTLHKIIKGEKV